MIGCPVSVLGVAQFHYIVRTERTFYIDNGTTIVR